MKRIQTDPQHCSAQYISLLGTLILRLQERFDCGEESRLELCVMVDAQILLSEVGMILVYHFCCCLPCNYHNS